MKARKALALALSFVVGFALAARADDKKDENKPKKAEKAEEAEEPDFPPFDKVTKDHAAAEGFWDLLYRAKDQGLLALIPNAELERPFLFTTSLSGGAPQAGWQLTSDLVAWERLNKKLVLVQKNVQFRADPERPIADAVVRTYSDRVILSTPILSESPKGLVIDLKEVLVGHAHRFLEMGIDGSLAKITKRKTFPTNVEVAFSAPLSGDGTLLLWHYSFRRLPNPGESGFKPRLADDRIGYFLTAVKDYTKGDPTENRFVRLVDHWDLQKAQPELPLSPPKTPITFYIEKTVPFRYRRWVEAGILEWNKAYEKCGFSGAVVVRQQTADNEFKDFDPEDARYNFFRWVVNDEGYAMGPSRTDPRTGQILDADIIFDDSMVEYYAADYETLLKEGPKVYMKADRTGASPETRLAADRLAQALEPLGVKLDLDRMSRALSVVPLVAGPARTLPEVKAKLERMKPLGCCEIGDGLRHELALGGAMKLLMDEDGTHARNVPDDFLGDCVKHIVMHEVGHTLGLRHNFKGSSWRTLEEINSAERPGDVSASVMDYCPLNIAPEGRPQGHYMNSTIGPYDYWAIEYGYRVPQDQRPDLDASELAAIAARSNEPGHAFGTDGDLGNSDPLCVQWDLGPDPMAFARARLDFAKRLRDKLMSRAVKVGESWEKLRRAFEMVLFEQARAGYYAARLVGAAEISRNHKGDAGERAPFELVPPAKQREALKFACEQVFDDKNFLVPAELLDHLGFTRWDHWGSSSPDAQYPIHERVLLAQRYTLATLMSDGLLGRLLDDQPKARQGEDPVTVEELFATLEGAIFKELDGKGLVNGADGHAPSISSFRQNLQDFYVRRLTDLSLDQQVPGLLPSAAAGKKIAAAHLEKLSKRCLDAAGTQLDETSKAHLVAIGRHAEQAKTAQYVHIASGAGCSIAPLGAPAALGPLGFALLLLVIRRMKSGGGGGGAAGDATPRRARS